MTSIAGIRSNISKFRTGHAGPASGNGKFKCVNKKFKHRLRLKYNFLFQYSKLSLLNKSREGIIFSNCKISVEKSSQLTIIDIYLLISVNVNISRSRTGYGPMSPHPGYGMTGVQPEYPGNTYTPYPTAGYNCGGTYPGGPVTSGYQIPAGYTPTPCYSMPPPQHTVGPLDKPTGKDDR